MGPSSGFLSPEPDRQTHYLMSATQEAQSSRSGDSFAALFEASIAQADSLKEGDIVSGTVIKLNKDSVVVDIGYKSEGLIPMSEFAGTGGQIAVKVGDQV